MLGLDLTCFFERDLSEERTNELIDEDGEEGDISNDLAFRTELLSLNSHTESNACLRKKSDTEVFNDSLLALNRLST